MLGAHKVMDAFSGADDPCFAFIDQAQLREGSLEYLKSNGKPYHNLFPE